MISEPQLFHVFFSVEALIVGMDHRCFAVMGVGRWVVAGDGGDDGDVVASRADVVGGGDAGDVDVWIE